MSESQNIEYKESWRDEYLKWICGFANAQGGRIYIGINDKQEIVGVADSKRLMEDIPNKIVNYLGIVADVNLLHSNEDKEFIEIVVEPSNVPIAYHGQYHYRSGSTKQEMKGTALQQFILKKMGRSWDDTTNDSAKLDDIDRNAIDYFLRRAINAQRIAPSLNGEDTHNVLHNLRLLSEDGHLKNAAILLFGKEPLRFFPGVEFHIGRFGMNEADLIFQDVVEGNILQMADKVVALLRSKYLISPIHYEGMQRIEPLEIPEDALREMIYNSLVHKLYVGVPIQMWVFNDHIELWNEGKLPDAITIDTLVEKHSSHPRNQLVASVFYKAGFIESWGRGIRKINEAFDKAGDHMGGARAIAHDRPESVSIVIPVGYGAADHRFTERIMRRICQADIRKPFAQLFEGISAPPPQLIERLITGETAVSEVSFDDSVSVALECVRRAPSSSNSQPWRAKANRDIKGHLTGVTFSCATYNRFSAIDMGIAYCHFIKVLRLFGTNFDMIAEHPSELPGLFFKLWH